jgi:hypothetical protein
VRARDVNNNAKFIIHEMGSRRRGPRRPQQQPSTLNNLERARGGREMDCGGAGAGAPRSGARLVVVVVKCQRASLPGPPIMT